MRKLRPESCRVTETTPALACGGAAVGWPWELWSFQAGLPSTVCSSASAAPCRNRQGLGASAGCPDEEITSPGEPGPKQSPQIKPSEVVHDPGNRHVLVLIPFHGPKQEAENPRFRVTQLRSSRQDSNLNLLESNSLTEVLWGFPYRVKHRETGVQIVPTRCPAQRPPQPPGDRGGGMWPQVPIRTSCFTL